MANYVITRIEASDGFDFTKKFKSFNDVLPMPKYVSKTTSGLVSRILEDDLKNNLALKEIVEPFREYDTLKIQEFVFAYRAYKRTGFADWYDWSIENWGSKWDMDILHIEKYLLMRTIAERHTSATLAYGVVKKITNSSSMSIMSMYMS